MTKCKRARADAGPIRQLNIIMENMTTRVCRYKFQQEAHAHADVHTYACMTALAHICINTRTHHCNATTKHNTMQRKAKRKTTYHNTATPRTKTTTTPQIVSFTTRQLKRSQSILSEKRVCNDMHLHMTLNLTLSGLQEPRNT